MSSSKTSNHVTLFDTTLRDGGQTKGVNYTLDDKCRIAAALDATGLDYIEAGWPGASPTDTAFFTDPPPLTHSKLTAFGMTCKTGKKPQDDPLLRKVLHNAAPVACLFGKTWDRHAEVALGVSLKENLALIHQTVAYGKTQKEELLFDAEHFFDGFKHNPDYALTCLKTAADAGADWLVLCDTNGGTLPHDITTIVKTVRKHLPSAWLGIHAHNDSDVAVANSLMAVQAGCRMVQGTMLGLGERCGNANLLSVAAALRYKMGFSTSLTEEALRDMTRLSGWLAQLTGQSLPSTAPYVGQAAFAHKGGVHVSAVEKDSTLYEHLDPALFGNKRQIPVSNQAGLSNLRQALAALGLSATGKEETLRQLLETVKKRELKGYTFDKAPESFAVLLATRLDEAFQPFTLTSHDIRIDGEHVGDNGDHDECAAKVRVLCHGKMAVARTVKTGPVDALDEAMRKALTPTYPELETVELIDFNSDLVDKTAATGAKTRVYITSRRRKDGKLIQTMGVSTNIVRASLEALADSYKYTILMEKGLVR